MKKLILTCALFFLPFLGVVAQTPPETSPNPLQNLISPQTGIDYAPLQQSLAQQKWRQANEQTRALMLRATNRELQGWVSPEQIQTFPCWDLETIDKLWMAYSKGHFGFSIQYNIFVATGNRPGKLVAIEKYQDFGDRIGWRKDDDWIIFKENLTYNINAPVGHLPSIRQEYQITGGRMEYTNLAQRMIECKLVPPPRQTPPTNKKENTEKLPQNIGR